MNKEKKTPKKGAKGLSLHKWLAQGGTVEAWNAANNKRSKK